MDYSLLQLVTFNGIGSVHCYGNPVNMSVHDRYLRSIPACKIYSSNLCLQGFIGHQYMMIRTYPSLFSNSSVFNLLASNVTVLGKNIERFHGFTVTGFLIICEDICESTLILGLQCL
jgi:hypothetical protein